MFKSNLYFIKDSVILKMPNTRIGRCGNDLAMDDIVFKTCADLLEVSDQSSSNSTDLCAFEIEDDIILVAIPDFSVYKEHFCQSQESDDNQNGLILQEKRAMQSLK